MSMLPGKILKLSSSEIARNMYFSIYFRIFKVPKEGNQDFEKWVGGVREVPPGYYVHGYMHCCRAFSRKSISEERSSYALWKVLNSDGT